MPRLRKRGTMACLALGASIWTIYAIVYFNIFGSMRRFESEKEEVIDFRVIVLTYSRSVSLLKALRSIDAMELDGDKAVLEIWIDRGKSGLVDAKTVEVAQSFNWRRGPTRVHIQKNHSGIRGQWIDSWTPTNDKELAVIVEDDLSLSRYSYRWIKAVHGFYGKRKDFAGTSLTSDQVVSHHISPMVQLKAPKNETVFMYSCVGSWGFSPKQSVWKRFQTWYHTHENDTRFHPYVDGIRPTLWYKAMEKSGTSDSAWAQWFIYFANTEKLSTIYNNLPTHVGDRNSCLSINRREVGLHNRRKGREDLCQLLNRWDERFVRFSENITRLDWAGKKVVETSAEERHTSQLIKSDSKNTTKLDGAGEIVVETGAEERLTSQLIKSDSKNTTKLDGAGREVVETGAEERLTSQLIKSDSKNSTKLDGAGREVVETGAEVRLTSQLIKSDSKNSTKLDGAGREVVETGAEERLTTQQIKSDSKNTTKLEGAGKKVVEAGAHKISTSQPIKV